MLKFTFFLLILNLVVCFCKKKSLIQPEVIFNLFWLWVMCAYTIAYEFFSFYIVSDKAIMIVMLGVASFNFGIYLSNRMKKREINVKLLEELDISLLKILMFFAVLFTTIISYRCVSLIANGYDGSDIRLLYGHISNDGPIRNALESIVYCFFLRPFLYIATVVLPIELYKKNKDRSLIILCILMICVSLTDGGRVTMYNIIVSFCITLVFELEKKKKLTEKLKLYVRALLIVLLMVLLMAGVSIFRGIELSNIMRQFITYYACGVELLDHYIYVWDDLGQYTYGMAFFGGIVRFFSWCFSQFGVESEIFKTTLEYGSLNLQEFVVVGFGDKMNAFVTAFYYFYMDFSYYGVVFGSMIWGWISNKAYRLCRREDDVYKYIYILIIVGVFNSMVRWPFFQSEYFFVFVYFLFIRRKKIY